MEEWGVPGVMQKPGLADFSSSSYSPVPCSFVFTLYMASLVCSYTLYNSCLKQKCTLYEVALCPYIYCYITIP